MNKSGSAFYARVISAATMVCGFVVAGLLLARWFQNRGHPTWVVMTAAFGGLVFALIGGWRELARLARDAAKSK